MSTGLLLITHGRLGQEMLETVTMIMCQCPLAVRTIGVGGDCNPDDEYAAAREACDELDQGNGVLVMTDLYGSTPSNIASQLTDRHNVHVISGINIPMLLRVMNYPDTQLDRLGEIAAEGARNGVILTRQQQAS